jgi:hypothetical protein
MLRPEGIGRRAFIGATSASIVGAMLPRPAGAQTLEGLAPAAAPVGRSTVRLSVGYLAGSDRLSSLQRLPEHIVQPTSASDGRFVPANGILADTSLFGRPLVIRVHGLYPQAARARRSELPRYVALDAVFPSPGPWQPDPAFFMAWGLQRRTQLHSGSPIRFTYPSNWSDAPAFDMKVVSAQGVTSYFRAAFTVGEEPGGVKLARGVYALGFSRNAWALPTAVSNLGRRAPARTFSVLITLEAQATS